MLKLSHTTRNAALATVLGVGLIGSAAVTLAPAAAQAQWREDDRGYSRDWDNRGYNRVYNRDWDDRHRGDWDDRYGIGVGGVGVGVYGAPYYYPYYSGYYNPYYYDSGPYCSGYDYYYGYCSY